MAAKLRKSIPSRLPVAFIPRTLARLLPQVDLATMTKDQLIAFAKKRDEIIEHVKSTPISFFEPHTGSGQEQFCRIEDPAIRVFAFFAGNKGGKTTAGAIKFIEHNLGQSFWDPGNRKLKFPVPIRSAIFAEDFDSHNEVSLPALYSWAPAGSITDVKYNPSGQPTAIYWSSGSITFIRTYDQGSGKAEGKDWSIVWCDEPPPRDIYTAIFRGLVATNGILLITATLLKEAWLYDETDNPFFKLFEGSIHDNTYLDDSARSDFLSVLDEEERQVRETGRPASLLGVIYKNFRDASPFVIPSHEIPPLYPIIMGVDPHERKKHHILYGYVNPQDEVIWFQVLLAGGTTKELATQLSFAEMTFPSKPKLCIMDPNRGAARQIDNKSWSEEYEKMGYSVLLGEDNIRIGHSTLAGFFDPVKPRMKFTENCRGKYGPIYQLLRYSWDDWRHNKRGQSQKEVPKQLHKDFPDVCRYVAMADLKFEALYYEPEIMDITPEGWRFRERVAYA